MEKEPNENIHHQNNNRHGEKLRDAKKKTTQKPIKIKYISSPIICEASNASEFRAIVQRRTGQDDHHHRSLAIPIPTTISTTNIALPAQGFEDHGQSDLRHHYYEHGRSRTGTTSSSTCVPESYGSWFSGDFSESFLGYLNDTDHQDKRS